MPAKRADNLEFLAVDYRDVITQVGTETDVMTACETKFSTFQDSLKDVLQKLRLAVLSFLFIGHFVLQKYEAPAGMKTDRGFDEIFKVR